MNPKLVFVASLFTSRIFWTQVIALAALVVTAAGYHPALLSAENQAELVGLVDALMTTIFRVTGPNGPVTLSAPLRRRPPPLELAPGTHTVTVSRAVPGARPAVNLSSR